MTNDRFGNPVFDVYHAGDFLPALPGDANLDGTVNGTDLNAVLSNYNLAGMYWADGDFNADRSVNGSDLNTVLSNYNQSQSSSVGVVVPEPSTLLCLLWAVGCGVGTYFVRRSRKRGGKVA